MHGPDPIRPRSSIFASHRVYASRCRAQLHHGPRLMITRLSPAALSTPRPWTACTCGGPSRFVAPAHTSGGWAKYSRAQRPHAMPGVHATAIDQDLDLFRRFACARAADPTGAYLPLDLMRIAPALSHCIASAYRPLLALTASLSLD
ncbi:hypothetical protein MSAN_00511800 [Mycena sanguinolenta]|uniref:Uncharacterized protein n=1 Tax=Mycena sanguinolenta TaxID=230812 RepID=A0A8H6Z657_9AGAR|nr:hypothetical protein MSAN_00511800 [Mycena sanguinolenta]